MSADVLSSDKRFCRGHLHSLGEETSGSTQGTRGQKLDLDLNSKNHTSAAGELMQKHFIRYL